MLQLYFVELFQALVLYPPASPGLLPTLAHLNFSTRPKVRLINPWLEASPNLLFSTTGSEILFSGLRLSGCDFSEEEERRPQKKKKTKKHECASGEGRENWPRDFRHSGRDPVPTAPLCGWSILPSVLANIRSPLDPFCMWKNNYNICYAKGHLQKPPA